jgi:tetratricopeptide (TPR) repeat protein
MAMTLTRSDPKGRTSMQNRGGWCRGFCLLTAGLVATVAGLGPASARGQGQAQEQELSIQLMRDWQYYNNTGWQAINRGRYQRAAEAFHLAIELLRPYEASHKTLLARSSADYARVLYLQKRYDEAEPLARWALSVRDTTPGTKPETLCQNLELLAGIQRARRKHAEAEPLLKRLVRLQERTLGTGHPDLIATVEALAGVAAAQGKIAEAEPYYRRALALREETSAANLKQAESLEQTVSILRQVNSFGAGNPSQSMRRFAQAEDLEVRARTFRESSSESVGAAVTTEGYAGLLRRAGRASEAESLEARAKAIRDAVETKAARARTGN